jgi:amidase
MRVVVVLVLALLAATPVQAQQVVERSISALQDDLASGRTTSQALVRAYLARIGQIDQRGPTLRSVIATNPQALEQARVLDAERRAGTVRGPLHGIPILIKDNIETADPMPTTAGALALANNITGRDAPLVARLRAAGAIVLGKTNLSEWANFRADTSISGWSTLGGQTRNPYALDRNPCGSSSGSGSATAASLAAASIGTETNGSIVCPAATTGLVGIKPTLGLVSRTHVVPIAASFDTAGPMTRTVRDAAVLLTVMAGSDPADAATAQADQRKVDYAAALDDNALKGKRIGVARFLAGYHGGTDAVFEAALATLKAAGAELVDIADPGNRREMGQASFTVMLTEFKAGLNAYLASTDPAKVPSRTMADVIALQSAQAARTMSYFGQDLFIQAQATAGLDDPGYQEALLRAHRLSQREGIDALVAKHKLDAIVAPTGAPAWVTDAVLADHFLGAASSHAAIAGYPHITVPMGQVRGLPVGLSLFGPAWSDAALIAMAYAFEQRTPARKAPTYPATLPGGRPD